MSDISELASEFTIAGQTRQGIEHQAASSLAAPSGSAARVTTNRAMAMCQRTKSSGGKIVRENYEVPVRVLAIAEGHAMVRRPGCSPFVIGEKRLRYLPPNEKDQIPRADSGTLKTQSAQEKL